MTTENTTSATPSEVDGAGLETHLAAAQSQIEDLNAQLGARDAKLGELQAVIASQSEAITQKDTEIGSLKAEAMVALAQLDATTQSLSDSIKEATSKYCLSLAAANPEIPTEMLSGDSIADIDASLDNARALVTRVKASLDEQARKTVIPAGAPERSAPDITSLSPRGKIEYAIRKEIK